MFDLLSGRLESVFKRLRSKGVIGEKDLREGLREVKLALLEADVHYQVVKDLLGRLEEKVIGTERIKGVSPAHQVVKVVYEELVETLGKAHQGLKLDGAGPIVILLLGLQGSGKTTTAAKIARYCQRKEKRPFLIAADIYRPAAIEQLTILAGRAGVPIHPAGEGDRVFEAVSAGMEAARSANADVVIIDSAGRLHCDPEMIAELQDLVRRFRPQETLLVIDGMTGQDGVNIAGTFHREVGLTGVILTKMEGDARGGAALSIYGVTGSPIKFIGIGEGIDDLEAFYPERMASRILNQGDIVTLVEKAQRALGEEELGRIEKKVKGKGEFDLDDFLMSIRQLRKMGPVSQLLKMVPGLNASQLDGVEMDPGQLSRVEAIILSMTPEERRHPGILNGSRRQRVARGSGASVQEVNRLLNQYHGMVKMFKLGGKPMKGKKGKKEFRSWP